MKKDREVDGVDDLVDILSDIKFAPSMVDMKWRWQAKRVYIDHPTYLGATTTHGQPLGVPKLAVLEFGMCFRTSFARPDRDTGVTNIGYGRWWLLQTGVTVSGVVKTAYAACKMILDHELMESFKYDGKRIFDPHHSVQALASLQKKVGKPR